MIKIKVTGSESSSSDLNIKFNKLTNIPLYTLDNTLIADTGIEETKIDNVFNKELYDTDNDSRFVNIVNILPTLYGYKFRLIYDKVTSNYFITFNVDYIPLLNTNNRSVVIGKLCLGGMKNITKSHTHGRISDTLSHELLGGLDNDIVIPEPNTTDDSQGDYLSTDDFKLIRLNLRGLLNPVETRLKIEEGDLGTYVNTNEIYMLGVDKAKAFGSDTSLHIHQVLPKTLNKFSIEYLGKISDIDYVYIPIQF